MIMARFDKLEGKTTNGNASGVDSSSKQPELDMPLNFYDNQNLYAATNKGKSVSSAIEVDKTGLTGSALTNQVVVYGQSSSKHSIKYQQQVELQRGKTFSPTHQSHQARFPYLMIHLLYLLLPLPISMIL
jgi:hypothetical protein